MRDRLLTAVLLCCAAAPAGAQLRVATWNVTNYDGTPGATNRNAAFQTAIYGVFEGRSMAPDLFVGQEFESAFALATFRNLLNAAPGSPGDWAVAPFLPGPDTESVLLFRTSRVIHLGTTRVVSGGPSPLPPRDVLRFDARLAGYSGEGAILSIYSVHMKAGNASEDQQRRLAEAEAIRADAELLPAGRHFLLAGDLNMRTSAEQAYQSLVQGRLNDAGRFFDPISSPGAWNRNFNFRFVHTQDPWPGPGTGGMDDRFDQILLSANLRDGWGFDYRGNAAVPYSTATWNDPNHSYRAWGNDGTSFDVGLRITGNAMVGPVIAQALVNSLDNQMGHLPVFLDLLAPPKIASETALDFGYVDQNATVSLPLTVANAGDTALWGPAGVGTLRYTMTGQRTLPPGGVFLEGIAPGGNTHAIRLDTSRRGRVDGAVIISSNDPDQPVRTIRVTGVVVGTIGARPPRR
jgi:hypothetical protein